MDASFGFLLFFSFKLFDSFQNAECKGMDVFLCRLEVKNKIFSSYNIIRGYEQFISELI